MTPSEGAFAPSEGVNYDLNDYTMFMTQKIVRLSESVINQIAAGEVVENPASIIKELIENSLDAGARHISIAIRAGGQLMIEIDDDGCGMSPEDAILSLERHATSKIRNVEDLFHLSTMGFRGEALAAIASVCHFEMKTSDGNVGTFIKAKGGLVEEITPCARNRGTTILIRSLFFNVPARKKFQKSIAANTAQVTKIVEVMSAANPHVSFTYSSQDERIYYFPIQERHERVQSVFGPFEHKAESSGFWGLFSAPELAKSHRRGQFLYINRRPVFSPLIGKAVQMGYGTRLKEHMYPSFALFLEIDPNQVDVNVHPQKKEVRLSNESSLFSSVERLVSDMFSSEPDTFSCRFSEPLVFAPPPPFLFTEQAPFPTLRFSQVSLPLEIQERPLFVLGKYLLMEKDGLFLVDLEGARARVCFEDLAERKGESQSLLWPLEIGEEDPEIVSALQKIGIEARQIGDKKIAIDALPGEMQASEFPLFFEAWKAGKKLEAASVRFCRHSNRKYSLEEALHIWRRLQMCKDRFYDPLGKKIWKKIEQSELDAWM